jgi:hypothetical protein
MYESVITRLVRTIHLSIGDHYTITNELLVIVCNDLLLRIVPQDVDHGGGVEQRIAVSQSLGQQRVVDPQTGNTLDDISPQGYVLTASHDLREPVDGQLVTSRPRNDISVRAEGIASAERDQAQEEEANRGSRARC